MATSPDIYAYTLGLVNISPHGHGIAMYHSRAVYLFIYFPKMCSLSLRINAHMKHAYKMFYNMIDYGITDW